MGPNSPSWHRRCSHRPSLYLPIPPLLISHFTGMYQIVTFLCTLANSRNVLLTIHSLMTPIHVSVSAQSRPLQKGLVGSTLSIVCCNMYDIFPVCMSMSCLCDSLLLLPESSSRRRITSNFSLYFRCLAVSAQ